MDVPTGYVEANFLKKFEEFVAKEPIHADFLLVSGDISDKGLPEEFDLGIQVVESVASNLGVDKKNIIFVPGNHDVDWSVIRDCEPHPVRMNQRYDPLKQSFCNRLGAQEGHKLAEEPYFTSWLFDDIFVMGYNSAWHDKPGEEIHHGRIILEHVEAMRAHLQGISLSREIPKLFIVHHHTFPYAELSWADFSIMANAEFLQNFLNEFRFDILVHGHKHVPRFNIFTTNSRHPLAVLGAGSFCRTLDSQFSGLVANQFHIIEVDKRSDLSGTLCGRVRNWAYSPVLGWQKSYQNSELERYWARGTGIEFEKPFGLHMMPDDIKNIMRGPIKASLAQSEVVNMANIYSQLPELVYLPNEALKSALTELSGEEGFTCMEYNDAGRFLIRDSNDV